MPIDYAVMRKELPRLKAALTRAIKSGDPEKILAEVKKAYARFDQIGWPDCWHRWEIAKTDVEMSRRYSPAGD